ncbi:MAG: MerR family transcriptional regulator [Synergistaceae bacterium]|jgi:DNA-binding transcriptional MerR regulator|nr:MerR family transcriptional regulator [Synergistaceae bacterium]
MEKKGLLSISELADFARITRTALIHYDKMGLLSPVERGENNYRYYSHRQIASINLIVTLQKLGVPLGDIAGLLRSRTPESIMRLFSEQSHQIDQKIKRLSQAQKLLVTLKNIIGGGVAVSVDGEEKIEVHWSEPESIFLGPQNDYSDGMSIEEATLNFYRYCSAKEPNMELYYPVWGLFSEKRIKRGDWVGPDRFYFKMPDAPDKKPEGLYITGYIRGNYGQSDALYKRLLAYIDQHHLEICGPAYETYPLNEISIPDPNQYLMRISITIKQR